MAGGVKVTVKDKDKGWARMVLGAESLIPQPYVKVGVIGTPARESVGGGVPVADVATFHEFGTENAPQRSFIRATVDGNIKKIQDRQNVIMKWVLFEGADTNRELAKLGLELQGMIQQRIKDRIPPPLAESTIKSKGSDVPLIDTGQLWRAVSFEVGKE